MRVRILPGQEERVETGPVQFGDDWPGIFIRGDNAFGLRMSLSRFLENPADVLAKAHVESFIKTLESCDLSLLEQEEGK